MDRDARNLMRPINSDFTSSSLSSNSDLFRSVQATFNRHRPLETSIRPKRMLAPRREVTKSSDSSVTHTDCKNSRDADTKGQDNTVKDSIVQPPPIAKEAQEDASVTVVSHSSSITHMFDENLDVPIDRTKPDAGAKDVSSCHFESRGSDAQKKVQFLVGTAASSLGADDNMATQSETLSSHMRSLALAEMEWVSTSQADTSAVINHDSKHQNIVNAEPKSCLKSGGGISFLAKRTTAVQDQLHQFRNFLSQPMTQSSVVGPSCATTTSVHATSAPMSTIYCSSLHHGSHVPVDPLKDSYVNPQPINAAVRATSAMSNPQIALATQPLTPAVDTQNDGNEHNLSKEQNGCNLLESEYRENPSVSNVKKTEAEACAEDVATARSQVTLPPNLCSDTKSEPLESTKQEKAATGKAAPAPRKKNKDSDLFIKVNGKLYQRLGKIGSGGSSEVHKVISSDCTIYALKKIKLKGRDYATAFGFCQEIEYLNKLKGKSHIIQLIDYEVTDKALLHAVLSGSINNKDGRVKDDGYIYMVLEYGEIDLAHMLSQKWKEMDGSNQTIDENWLRFYWQQILLAVSTIHEERIVHSDLKPANFLLVRGSLKLIDFGIAKAIMSDTTNIQRDSQVGTLSYMSPEAFMCNETDADGNTIKCGRPSDIWSLGCILYQMVYGRTPFADYKTFWAKFKVITDPNHQIAYETVSNPWLLDLMRKCLAWDRNDRWRIPELLQHPFLVPPVPTQPSSHEPSCKLLRLIGQNCTSGSEASSLYCQLKQLLENPLPSTTSQLLPSPDQQCTLLSQVSKVCLQLQEHFQRDT
ncbi:serine/threonine-protein kinase MPS1 isoform X2 [Argentina anserina]|uniref:serine/threonine-protein kinase MPS1 isoform X2 n=1 Tax=Argentina anserina TaxID=57926 RepID=UPI0021764642|nr:serine/threonine-protein kinase MPS1 isoform X2 [Potentilla anserina]